MSNKHMLSVRVDNAVVDDLVKYAAGLSASMGKNLTVSDVIREMIEDKIKPMEPPYHQYEAFVPTTRKELYKWYEHYTASDVHVSNMIEELVGRMMNGFRIGGPNEEWFSDQLSHLNLEPMVRNVAKEYFSKGDVFVRTILDCPSCDGNGVMECGHEKAEIRNLVILDAGSVDIIINPISMRSVILATPSTEVKRIVLTGMPKNLYDEIDDDIKKLVRNNQPITMRPDTITHLKRGGSSFSNYGESILKSRLAEMIEKDRAKFRAYAIGDPEPIVDDRPSIDEEIKIINMLQCRGAISKWLDDKVIGLLARCHGIKEAPVTIWGDIRVRSDKEKWFAIKAWREGILSDGAVMDMIGLDPTAVL